MQMLPSRLIVGAILFCVLAPARAAEPPQALRNTPLVVIVSSQSTLRDISYALLRLVFKGEIAEHQGIRLVPFNYGPSDPLRVAFDRLALGFSPDATGRHWVDRRIRGQSAPPRTIPSQDLLRAVVAKIPGGIGYVTADQVDGTVRALSVDGHRYDDPDYPLAPE